MLRMIEVLEIPRIDISFLVIQELKDKFISNMSELIMIIPECWNPHMKLEYLKTCTRSEAFAMQGLFKVKTENELDIIRKQIDQLDENQAIPNDTDLGILQEKLDTALANESKRLARKATTTSQLSLKAMMNA